MNQEYTFDIYGKGEYFEHNDKPKNIRVYNRFIKQDSIPDLLNHYRCALMPTRLDAQGVMMCEIATFGMPVITSDLHVSREMLSDFSDVIFVANGSFGCTKISIGDIVNSKYKANKIKFDPSLISKRELEIIKNV